MFSLKQTRSLRNLGKTCPSGHGANDLFAEIWKKISQAFAHWPGGNSRSQLYTRQDLGTQFMLENSTRFPANIPRDNSLAKISPQTPFLSHRKARFNLLFFSLHLPLPTLFLGMVPSSKTGAQLHVIFPFLLSFPPKTSTFLFFIDF